MIKMNFAIIVAAGSGKRMTSKENKIFLSILKKPMIYYTLKAFQDCSSVDEIIIVTQKKYFKKIFEVNGERGSPSSPRMSLKNFFGFNKIKNIVEGGKERQDSVYNGLMSIRNAKNDDIVIVHNGSNPLVKENEIVECVNAAKQHGAAVCCFPLKDTIKKVSNNFIEKTIDRNNVYQMQTPQAIKYDLFVEGFKNVKKNKLKVTDDVSVVELLGKKVKIVPCSYENRKITTKDDLKIAEGILMKRNGKNFFQGNFFRIGIGQDSHNFSKNKNKKLVLGGYTIPKVIGLEANSDGDIILHALFNAISSAIGEKSLGFYADQLVKEGITNSKEYLEVVLDKLKLKNLIINNVSIAIEALKPRLDNHTDKIKASLSKILKLNKDKIGITYTSGEQLTAFGQGKGMQCFAVVTII